MRYLALALMLLTAVPALATDYHIGPGQAYTSIGAAPWSSLVAGDTVYIHAKPTPYYEHLYIGAAMQGTQANPIRIIGVSDGSGNQPILDGTNSTMGPNFDFYGSAQYRARLGVIAIGPGATAGYGSFPQWVELSNIRVQNYVNVTTTDADGTVTNNFTGEAIYLQSGKHITFDHMTLTGCADGLFIKDVYGSAHYITLKNSYIYGNGVSGSYYYHNTYTEGKYVTFENNHFGPIATGSLGNNIKSRDAGFVMRYNYVDGGQHLVDLVECQDNCADHTSDPAWGEDFIYGNVLYAGPGQAAKLIHLGTGDTGAATSSWRKNLYFYDNTVHVKRDQSETWGISLFQISGGGQTAYIDNDIFAVEPVTGTLPEIYLQSDESGAPGNMVIGKNWITSGWLMTYPGGSVTGSVTGTSNFVSTGSLDFASSAAHDYRLAAGSAAIGVAGALRSKVTANWTGTALIPASQYVLHQSVEPRVSLIDLGAYSYAGYVPPPTGTTTRSLNGRLSGKIH